MLSFIKSLFGIKKTFVEIVYIPEEKIDAFFKLYDAAGVTYTSNRELWKFIDEILKNKKEEILANKSIAVGAKIAVHHKIKVDPLSPYIEMTYKI